MNNIAFWMWFVLFFIAGLVFFIIIIARLFYKNILEKEQRINKEKLEHQKELLKTSITVQEKERKRIAENLHDDVISQLHRIKLLNNDSRINELIKNGISTTRTISHLLSPPLLEETPFKDLIIEFLQAYKEKYTIHITINADENRVDNLYKLNIYRIFQEVITNCNKHAKANTIEVMCKISKKIVCLIIRDDGIGMDLKGKKGMGYKNIESRTQVLNGSFKFKQNKLKGTSFIFLTNNGR